MHEYFSYCFKKTQGKINVKLQPASAKDLVMGFCKIDARYYLKIKVRALQIEGKANEALILLLAKLWSLKKGDISIDCGHTSRQKIILIKNIEYDYLKKKLANYMN
jgi:uncharacterized protein (TIGR00251 family)